MDLPNWSMVWYDLIREEHLDYLAGNRVEQESDTYHAST